MRCAQLSVALGTPAGIVKSWYIENRPGPVSVAKALKEPAKGGKGPSGLGGSNAPLLMTNCPTPLGTWTQPPSVPLSNPPLLMRSVEDPLSHIKFVLAGTFTAKLAGRGLDGIGGESSSITSSAALVAMKP